MKDNIEEFITFYKNERSIGSIDPNIWMTNYLIDRLELNDNQILWFIFLCSITYHLPTSYLLLNEYPDLELIQEERLNNWWNEVQSKCPFQKDKLKQRKFLPETIISYKELIGDNSQKEFFEEILSSEEPHQNFKYLWDKLYKNIRHFGRFSVWNWSQMLKSVYGLNIEPENLMLGEPNSESHTHGFCYVHGKYEWTKKERVLIQGKKKKITHSFTKEEKIWLETQSEKIKMKLLESDKSVDNFYLETVACAFKKLFRNRDSRYVGYYLDRQAEDIISIEKNGFDGVDWSILWDARNELLEKNVINNSVNKDKFNFELSDKIIKCNVKESKDETLNIIKELF